MSLNPNAFELGRRVTAFCASAVQLMPPADVADGMMAAALNVALGVLSREEVAEWLRRLAADIEDSEPTKEVFQ